MSPNLPPSQYLDQDLDALERLDTLPPQQARGRRRPVGAGEGFCPGHPASRPLK